MQAAVVLAYFVKNGAANRKFKKSKVRKVQKYLKRFEMSKDAELEQIALKHPVSSGRHASVSL